MSLNVKHPVYPSPTYITKQSGLSFVFYEDMHVNMTYIVGKEIVSSVVKQKLLFIRYISSTSKGDRCVGKGCWHLSES